MIFSTVKPLHLFSRIISEILIENNFYYSKNSNKLGCFVVLVLYDTMK